MLNEHSDSFQLRMAVTAGQDGPRRWSTSDKEARAPGGLGLGQFPSPSFPVEV